MFTDYLIIDSRNYPNWTLIKLSKLLINGRTKFAKFINMDLDYPGSFKWTESQTIGNKMKGYEGNIFVLVDLFWHLVDMNKALDLALGDQFYLMLIHTILLKAKVLINKL